MHMYHLTQENCPTCGARTVSCNRRGQHTSGEWFETRTYECEYIVEYIPNFSSTRQVHECTRTKEYHERGNKRRKAIDEVMFFIDKLDVDLSFRNKLRQEVSNMGYLRDIYC